MAGHSKWANTRHRKAAQDAKRGKIFTKIIRELVTAAKLGGGDPDANPRLRAAIDKALSNNMTRDTLNRAIARGVGGDDDANMETIIYEGYGPGGTAIMIECLSDNRNRTVAEVRHAFSKCGGNLGTDGSVAYLFSKKGVISFEKGDEDTIMEAALEADEKRQRASASQQKRLNVIFIVIINFGIIKLPEQHHHLLKNYNNIRITTSSSPAKPMRPAKQQNGDA